MRFATARLGLRLSPGATILDFGCGIGSSVRALLAQGLARWLVEDHDFGNKGVDVADMGQAGTRGDHAIAKGLGTES